MLTPNILKLLSSAMKNGEAAAGPLRKGYRTHPVSVRAWLFILYLDILVDTTLITHDSINKVLYQTTLISLHFLNMSPKPPEGFMFQT